MTHLALLAEYPDIAALFAATLTLAARSLRLPPLRPLAAAVAALAALDVALLAPLPRGLYVAAFAGWYVVGALAVAGPLVGRWGPLAMGAAAWWAVEVVRLLAPPWPIMPAEWAGLWAVATAGQGVAVAAWAVRAWRSRRAPTLPQQVALLLAAGALADAVGPWAAGAVGAAGRWEVGRWQGAATWVGVVGVVGWRWGRARR